MTKYIFNNRLRRISEAMAAQRGAVWLLRNIRGYEEEYGEDPELRSRAEQARDNINKELADLFME